MQFNKIHVLNTLKRYDGQPHSHGGYDCNRLLLEALEHDPNNIPEYSTPIQGRTVLRKYLNVRNMKQYLLEVGFKQIDPRLISDFDVIIDGLNCSFYLDRKMFGTREGNFCFVPYNNDQKMEIYRWQ